MNLVIVITVSCSLIGSLIEAASVARKLPTEEYQAPSCGYQSCAKSHPDKLNIHLVAHTHDDVGWLKTLDQYYYGEKPDIQRACVQDIINSVVDALVQHPTRKFIYVETAYLWKWLSLQNETRRETMKQLVDEARLEIIGGGWTMNDEATTHYQSLIDQYTWGFRRLNDTFGECARPKIGWQIDPFGHSREQASMFAQLGFDGLLFGRLDYQDKKQRLQDKTMEFIWQGSPNLGHSANIFTSVLYHLYQPPDGFCFDVLCGDTLQLDERNLQRRVGKFLKFADEQSTHYLTNNVILTMGGDFTYQDAELYYKNLDKLISGINELHGDKYNAFYSTPSCYLKAVNEANLTWTTESEDFLPYASEANAYWTGYFSSRPALKFIERMANNLLQVVKQLSVVSGAGDSKELQLFREAMAVMQHHDAVTGTEKQHVAEDYARILHHSMANGEGLASEALSKLTQKGKAAKSTRHFHTCLLLNVSSCEQSSESAQFVVTVYNPTSQPLSAYVRLPIVQSRESTYTVLDFNGEQVVTQMAPVTQSVLDLAGRSSNATRELVFRATNISALGYQSFHVVTSDSTDEDSDDDDDDDDDSQSVGIGNANYKVSVDEETNYIVVQSSADGIEYEQSIEYYESASGVNVGFNRSSGAYIFRPAANSSSILSDSATAKSQAFKGPLFEEIHQVINDWISQVVRIYKQEDYVEFDWLVGPIPIDDKIGKEVVIKYTSNLKSEDEFYTDSNGREMLKRKLNYRPTWKLELNETISANYYPVTAKISIQDEESQRRLSVLNDRAQGGSSLQEGQVELMVHRRMLSDDGYGVDESLNETAFGHGLVARGRHIVVAGDLQDRDRLLLQEKQQAIELALRPWIFVTPTEDSFEKWSENYEMKSETIIGSLPKNVRILTLEPWKDGQVLLRLEHLFELGESPKYSLPARIDIKELFPKFHVLSVSETTLGANQFVEQSQRLQWTANKHENSDTGRTQRISRATNSDSFTLSLKPMEIRTFILKLSSKPH